MTSITNEIQNYIEQANLCGYSFKELLIFADACRKAGIHEDDLHDFCLNATNAYNYILEEFHSEFEKRMM